ncbi:embryonic polyadenylate-binding protein 2 [Protopterus annectens]|uniref:embryonic polyadenylate-binding protein 2 n=1 Tax=Protopterus annectens TaxID=7888 RepID=UPI001CFB77E8|nr:embryonic polyadenylate-binding protein 2 [Protopterus annectens]
MSQTATSLDLSPGLLNGDCPGFMTANDPELEAIKARIREMEDEEEKLKELQHREERCLIMSTKIGNPVPMTAEERIEADNRSVYVGNVDYGAAAEELESHFNSCGMINRVTILCDKFSGHPKGYAYIEFVEKDSVRTAITLDESLFRGRIIKVLPKRTNMPGISSTDRGGPLRRFNNRAVQPPWKNYDRIPRQRARGRNYRGRGRFVNFYSPY